MIKINLNLPSQKIETLDFYNYQDIDYIRDFAAIICDTQYFLVDLFNPLNNSIIKNSDLVDGLNIDVKIKDINFIKPYIFSNYKSNKEITEELKENGIIEGNYFSLKISFREQIYGKLESIIFNRSFRDGIFFSLKFSELYIFNENQKVKYEIIEDSKRLITDYDIEWFYKIRVYGKFGFLDIPKISNLNEINNYIESEPYNLYYFISDNQQILQNIDFGGEYTYDDNNQDIYFRNLLSENSPDSISLNRLNFNKLIEVKNLIQNKRYKVNIDNFYILCRFDKYKSEEIILKNCFIKKDSEYYYEENYIINKKNIKTIEILL